MRSLTSLPQEASDRAVRWATRARLVGVMLGALALGAPAIGLGGCSGSSGDEAHEPGDAAVTDDVVPGDPGDDDAAPEDRDAAAADAHADAQPDGAAKDAGPPYPVPPTTEVITAEQASGKVIVFDYNVTDWSKPNAVVWSWTPPSSGFSNLSDVKYSKDGKRFLVAASGGGIAVVQISNKALLLQATPGGNTHAIEELPDGSVVSASSSGGYLKLFSKTGAELQTVTFTDAHGVYWDGARQRLYADGGSVVRAFTYSANALHDAGSWSLPSGQTGAHDLFPVPYSNQLYVSNLGHVFQFDRVTGTFGPYASGPDRSGIKAVGHDPGSSTVCLIKATNAPGPQPRSWSTDTVIFDQPGSTPATVTRVRPGAQFYKARWAAPTP